MLHCCLKKRLQIVFLSVIITSIFLLQSAAAAEVSWDIEYHIDAFTGEISQEIKVQNGLSGGYYWESFDVSPVPHKINDLDWSGDCDTATARQGEFEGEGEFAGQTFNYDYLTCSPGGGKFESGETFSISLKGECNCTQKWGGIIHESNKIRVYPYNFHSYANQEANLKYSIIAPANYYVSNSSMTGSQVKESSQVVEVTLQSKLVGDESVSKQADFFVEFTRKLDFKKIDALTEKYKDTQITVKYPAGFEKDAADIISEMQKILPYYESYGAITFEEITLNIVENESFSCNTAGCAFPPEEKINISISADLATFYHEVCHLTEKPFYYPSWFAEGEATNCEVAALKYFGFVKKAEESENWRIEGSKLPFKLNLQTWVAIDNIKEDVNKTNKGYGLAFILMKEILESVSLTDFYTAYRNQQPINITIADDQNDLGFWFNNINNSGLDLYLDIRNSPELRVFVTNRSNEGDYYWEEDESINDTDGFWVKAKDEFSYFGNKSMDYWVICKLNNVSKKDMLPIFRRYGFEEIKSCEGFYSLSATISARAIADFGKAQALHRKGLTSSNIFGIVLTIFFFVLIITIIYYVVKFLKRKLFGKK